MVSAIERVFCQRTSEWRAIYVANRIWNHRCGAVPSPCQAKQLKCILINNKNKIDQRVGGFFVEEHSCKIRHDSEVKWSRTLRYIFPCANVLENKGRIHFWTHTPCLISLHSLSWNLILLHAVSVKKFDNNITYRVILPLLSSVILAVYDWTEKSRLNLLLLLNSWSKRPDNSAPWIILIQTAYTILVSFVDGPFVCSLVNFSVVASHAN